LLKIDFYTKDNCALCEEAAALLNIFKSEYSFEIEEKDIYTNDAWLEEYQLLIPAIRMNNTLITCQEMDYETLDKLFRENMKSN